MPGEKPAEASLDWKSNGHTAPGLGIEPGLSGPQRRGSTATLPANSSHYGILNNSVRIFRYVFLDTYFYVC